MAPPIGSILLPTMHPTIELLPFSRIRVRMFALARSSNRKAQHQDGGNQTYG